MSSRTRSMRGLACSTLTALLGMATFGDESEGGPAPVVDFPQEAVSGLAASELGDLRIFGSVSAGSMKMAAVEVSVVRADVNEEAADTDWTSMEGTMRYPVYFQATILCFCTAIDFMHS